MKPRAWHVVAGLGLVAGAIGLWWFLAIDPEGEAVWLGELLMAAAALLLAAMALALWREPRQWRSLLFLAPAIVFGLFGFYACWVAGIEGDCHLFG